MNKQDFQCKHLHSASEITTLVLKRPNYDILKSNEFVFTGSQNFIILRQNILEFWNLIIMEKEKISRFPVPDINSLPEDIKSRILEVQEKSGFVPNVFLALAYRPDEFRAFFAYHDALMNKESGLSKGEKEMIVVATSALNSCIYCVVAHGAILRIREKSSLIADQIATNYRKADISDRQLAMLDFAVKVSRVAYEVLEEDIQVLAQHGFSEQDVWDIGSIAAFFALSNRLANMANIRPNDEFYHLGRIEIG